jgi:L-lactate utilization protein LutC
MQSKGEVAVPDAAVDMSHAQWTALPDQDTVTQTVDAIIKRGIKAELLPNKSEALRRLVELIPMGAEVMTGGSETLRQIGFIDLLKSDGHSWKNLKDTILAESDPAKQMELRVRSTASEYFVGSVQAVTQSGDVVAASAGGSQLAAYAFTARNLIWVVGTQKIVPTLDDALKRIRDYALPLEDKRMKAAGFPGSFIGKILIFEREVKRRDIHLLFVNEPLGF